MSTPDFTHEVKLVSIWPFNLMAGVRQMDERTRALVRRSPKFRAIIQQASEASATGTTKKEAAAALRKFFSSGQIIVTATEDRDPYTFRSVTKYDLVIGREHLQAANDLDCGKIDVLQIDQRDIPAVQKWLSRTAEAQRDDRVASLYEDEEDDESAALHLR